MDGSTASNLVMTVYAFSILALALFMPLIKKSLHGGIVDIIYYGSAIFAALIFFIGNAKEREKNYILADLELLNGQLSQMHQLYAVRESILNDVKDQLNHQQSILKDSEARRKEPWVQELVEAELEVSKDLIFQLKFDDLVAYLPHKLKECENYSRELDSLIQLYTDLAFIENGLREPTDWASDSDNMLVGAVDSLQAKIRNCQGFQPSAERVIADIDYNYVDLLTLHSLATNSNVNWRGWVEPSEQVALKLRRISLLSSILQRPEIIAGKIDTLDSRIQELHRELNELELSRGDIQERYDTLQAEVRDIENAAIDGIVRRAKDWGDRYWPYFLILLLGMKIARGSIFARS